MKDAPNDIPMNIIGSTQNSREIFRGGGVPISPNVVITPKALRYKRSQLRSHYPHFEQRVIKLLYELTLYDSVRHLQCHYSSQEQVAQARLYAISPN